MSLDVYLKSNEEQTHTCSCSKCGHEHIVSEYETLFDYNITHNLNKMAEAAGIYYHLWHPEKLGLNSAHQLIGPLESGLRKLKESPEIFKAYNPANGWGTYENLVDFVTKYLAACKAHPNAQIFVST